MTLLRFKFAAVAFFVSGCTTIIDNPRNSLVDEKMPFGLSWSLTSEERANFGVEHAAECAEIFENLEDVERESAIQNCLQENRVSSSEELPSPLEHGFLEVFYTPDGKVIGRSHTFGIFSASFPEVSETESQNRAQIIAYEIEQWTAALKLMHGDALAHGQVLFGEFEGTGGSDAPCAAWYVKPVAILLCRSRPFTPDASKSSLSFTRLDRINRGRALQNQIARN